MQRRLTAILAADVVGYSRLMEIDEAGTLAALKAHRAELIDPKIGEHGGRIVKLIGDGMLVEFPSVVGAVACAAEIQQAMAARNADVPEDRRIVLRVGINLGDVIVEDDDIFGDGVNVAARLEGIAPPGGIAVSATVRDQVGARLDLPFEDLGEQALKNIARPIRVYSISFGEPSAPSPRPARPQPDKPSVAVLPFVNLSADPGQQFFSDGITEDIITELARFRQLHVLARTSSFRYRGADLDMIRVGRELGVQYLLEGSVRRLGKRIRIAAQLIDAASGHHLWAERFDRDEEETFAVQDQVVRTIVGTLVGRLQAAGAEIARRKAPTSLAAYEYLLRGDALPLDSPEAEAEARRLYEKAIAIDPGYGRAHALLAYLVHLEWLRDMSGSDRLLDRAFELATKAIALDENDGTCQALLGLIQLNRQSYELAEHHYLKALELNRNSSSLMASVGSLYGYLGKPEKGMAYFEEARLLDPFFDPPWYWPSVGIVHFIAGRYDEAVAALARSPSMPFWAYPYLAASHALAGRTDPAGDCAAEVIRLMPDFSPTRFAAKESFKRPQDRDRLIDGLRRAGLRD